MVFKLRSSMAGTGTPQYYPVVVFEVTGSLDEARVLLGNVVPTLAGTADTITVESEDGAIVERWTIQDGRWKLENA
jgi:hypothetical protein